MPHRDYITGLDHEAFPRLTASERAKVEELVVSALDKPTTDERLYYAAALLKSRAAAPKIKQQIVWGFPKDRGSLRVISAMALFEIESWPPAKGIIIDALLKTPPADEWTRTLAEDYLPIFGRDPDVIDALFRVLDDPGFVSSNATIALEAIYREDKETCALVRSLRETLTQPHRRDPGFMERRRRLVPVLRRMMDARAVNTGEETS
jgi:hypothetical protein